MKKGLLLIFMIFSLAVFSNNSAWANQPLVHHSSSQSTESVPAKTKGCNIDSYATAYGKCIFCPLFKSMYSAAEMASAQSAKWFGSAFSDLLAVGMALFIAFHTLKLVTSFSQTDSKKYIQTIGMQFFKMMVAFILLRNMGQLYSLLINPLLNAGLDMGIGMMGGPLGGDASEMTEKCNMSASATGAGFGATICDRVVGFVELCQKKLRTIHAMGRYFICASWEERDRWWAPIFSLLFNGIILVVLAFFVILSFGFLLIDAIVQMAIVGSLLPLSVFGWPFKLTEKFVGPVWKMFLGIFLTFAFAGVTVAVVKNLVISAVQMKSGREGTEQVSFDALYEFIKNLPEKDKFVSNIESDSTSVLITLACAVLAFRLCGKIDDLIGEFGGENSVKFGSGLGGTAASVTKSLVKTGGQLLKKGAKRATKKLSGGSIVTPGKNN